MKVFKKIMAVLLALKLLMSMCYAADPVVLYMSQEVDDDYLYLSLQIENTESVAEGILGMKLTIIYNGRYFRPVLENGRIFTDAPGALYNSSSDVSINMDIANSIVILTSGDQNEVFSDGGLLGVIKFQFLDKADMPLGTYTFDYNKRTGENEVVTANYETLTATTLYGTTYVNSGQQSGDTPPSPDQAPATEETPSIFNPPVYIGGGKIQHSSGVIADLETRPTTVDPESGEQEINTAEKRMISFQVGNKNMSIDDDIFEMEAAPYIENDRCLLPIRYLAEALMYDVEWSDELRKVTITKDETVIELYIGGYTAYVNNATRPMDVCPEITQDRTFVPLRFITEELSGKVMWDQKTQSIVIEL